MVEMAAEFAKGTCFGVDCIASYPMIRKTVLTSVTACDQFLQLIKGIIQAEEVYSRSLAKISTISIPTFPGTLQDCFEQLKSDSNHKSAQHLDLAENLSKEIYTPILELRNQLELKEKEIACQYLRMQQEIKHLEDIYKKRFHTFEKVYHDAYMAIEQSKNRENGDKNNVTPHNSNLSLFEETNTFISSFATSLPPSITSFTGKTKGKDILQWVVASATASTSSSSSSSTSSTSPSSSSYSSSSSSSQSGSSSATSNSKHSRSPDDPQDDKAIISTKLAKADKQRMSARKAWIEYVITSQRYSIKCQILITKMQALLESFVVNLQDHMRKMIVFESSSLANQQYDLNMLFKAMDKIDVRGDLLGIIHSQRNNIVEGKERSLWSSDIFFGANLSHITALPRPPINRQLTTDLPETPIYLDEATASQISRMNLLQKQQLESKETIVIQQGLGVYDGVCDLATPDQEIETDEKSDEEWYECAEDALTQLLNLQNVSRQYWLDVITEFNHEENSSQDPSHVQAESGGETGACEEKTDSEEDNPSLLIDLQSRDQEQEQEQELGQHQDQSREEYQCQYQEEELELEEENEEEPASLLEDSNFVNKAEDIIASWGLLDAVQLQVRDSSPVPLLSGGGGGEMGMSSSKNRPLQTIDFMTMTPPNFIDSTD